MRESKIQKERDQPDVKDGFVDAARLHVDTLAMQLVARMHGAGWYTRSTDLFQLARPVYADWICERE